MGDTREGGTRYGDIYSGVTTAVNAQSTASTGFSSRAMAIA
jgi:hypothetical protein